VCVGAEFCFNLIALSSRLAALMPFKSVRTSLTTEAALIVLASPLDYSSAPLAAQSFCPPKSCSVHVAAREMEALALSGHTGLANFGQALWARHIVRSCACSRPDAFIGLSFSDHEQSIRQLCLFMQWYCYSHSGNWYLLSAGHWRIVATQRAT